MFTCDALYENMGSVTTCISLCHSEPSKAVAEQSRLGQGLIYQITISHATLQEVCVALPILP